MFAAEQSLPTVISNILTTTNNSTTFTFLVLDLTYYELHFCTIRDNTGWMAVNQDA